jgi:hypothetical protein
MRTTLEAAAVLSVLLLSSPAALVFDTGYAASDATDESKAGAASATSLDAARLTDAGELLRPANLDEWVFLGASLGMGYDNVDFDPKSPGNFQVVLMEPSAYAYFKTNGQYANGSMFLLSFYRTEQRVSIDRAGFVQGELKNFEIHLLDRSRFAEGRAFYLFGPKDDKGAVLPPGSPCVECHVRDGAFDGTFAQFYPALRHRIPADLLNKSRDKGAQH